MKEVANKTIIYIYIYMYQNKIIIIGIITNLRFVSVDYYRTGNGFLPNVTAQSNGYNKQVSLFVVLFSN